MKLSEIKSDGIYVVRVGGSLREVIVAYFRAGKVHVRDAKTGRDLPKGRSPQSILYQVGNPESYQAYKARYGVVG